MHLYYSWGKRFGKLGAITYVEHDEGRELAEQLEGQHLEGVMHLAELAERREDEAEDSEQLAERASVDVVTALPVQRRVIWILHWIAS